MLPQRIAVKSVACKEYIPKRIDKDGELAITDKAIDVSLLKMVGGGEISSNGKNILIIACVALIVIIGASVSIIFIIKHRKKREEYKTMKFKRISALILSVIMLFAAADAAAKLRIRARF